MASPEYDFPPLTPLGRADLSHRRPAAFDRFWFGACYYPEHWDAATRARDAARMAAAGFNVVRMAEFAWDLMEPAEGTYDFSLFDATLAELARHGIHAILCTPTATPPRWLTCKHPEILRVDDRGAPLDHGSRQHANMSHPIFREYSRRITRAMAEHFREVPNVCGWQTDNEIYCHFAEDHGPATTLDFQGWLRRRYANDIAVLNQTWGTQFWSQTYAAFDEIPTPRDQRPTYLNPAHRLDYAHFISDVAARFQHEQVAILRAANPRWFILHNGIMRRLDYRGLFGRDLDVLGYDVYPMFEGSPTTRTLIQAEQLDRIRSLTGNFIIPEHQSGPGGQPPYFHSHPEPGEIRNLTWRSIARGADSLLYFRWRTCRFGAEIYWTGILDHDDVPRRRYEEVRQIGQELGRVGQYLLGTRVLTDCAVANGDYANVEAHESYAMGLPAPNAVAAGVHCWFQLQGHAIGCIHPTDSLEGVKLYVIPHWVVFDPAWVPALEAWVKAGGVLVIGARTATRDLHNNVTPATHPGCLADLCGCTVAEYGRSNPGDGRPLQVSLGGASGTVEHWYEHLQPGAGTEVLATWQGRAHHPGKAAVTQRRLGQGWVVYCGLYLTESVHQLLLPELSRLAGLKAQWPDLPAGVEVVRRHKPGQTLWFFLNRGDQEQHLKTLPVGRELTQAGDTAGAGTTLEPHGVRIVLQQEI